MGADREPHPQSMVDHLTLTWSRVPVLVNAASHMRAMLQDPMAYRLSVLGEEDDERRSLFNAYEVSCSYELPEGTDPRTAHFLQVSFTLQQRGDGIPHAVFGHDIGVVQVPKDAAVAGLVEPFRPGVDYYPVMFQLGRLLATSGTSQSAPKRQEIQDMLTRATRMRNTQPYQVSCRTSTGMKGVITRRSPMQ